MPHKHKRRFDGDESHFDLPPTVRAIPLPVSKGRDPNPVARHAKKAKLNPNASAKDNGYGADDTPKAFSRMMAYQARGTTRSGLDDGPKLKKKKNKATENGPQTDDTAEPAETDTIDSEAQALPKLTIQPGERLSEFAQRVNQALPLTGVNKNGKKIAGVRDHRVTRHEKKLKKLQKGWREDEARIRDKELEAQELAEEERDEEDAMWEDKTAQLPDADRKGSKKKKTKRRLVAGEVDDKEDPWEALKKSRVQRKGLHDVVQAPPTFDRVPREIFKVKNGAKVNTGNIPNKAGSLRKREELGEERRTIIDTYRALMAAKREG